MRLLIYTEWILFLGFAAGAAFCGSVVARAAVIAGAVIGALVTAAVVITAAVAYFKP